MNIHRVLEDQYNLLDIMATSIKNKSVESIHDLYTTIDSYRNHWDFQNIILVEANGLGHITNGQTISFQGDTYLQDTILNKEQSLSTLHTIDNQKTVILASPIEGVILDNNEIVFIFCGIILIFFTLLLMLLRSQRLHRFELENIAYVDPITGGNTLEGFSKLAKEVLMSPIQKQYALVYINIRNFKVINEQLGHLNCDRILHALYESIHANLTNKEIIGRVTADNFCVLLEYHNNRDLLARFDNWYIHTKQSVEDYKPSHWMIREMEFGVYIVENHTVPLPQMITRAKIALREAVAVHNTRFRYALYNDQMRLQLLREKQLEDMAEDALKKGEFQVYLQPKYRLPDERMTGAEALTRWISELEGMISPDEFIPLFEKNGFIIQLDLWVFEEVCRMIRAWLDEEKELIKISINCSRTHFKKPDFFKEYIKIAKSYNVPENLIEIELTESLFLDNKHFIQIIEEIRKAGFSCSVDDFGSGYSSLNLIKAIPVDTLKLDKVFFHNSVQDRERAESVISSVISMAKVLSMETVAEGVEEREQVEMLKRLGCDYIQGYVFSKPKPMEDFKQLL
ncbi:putative bifunctional diguanylate cyclase/phosphodiesterase [Paenibacillus sp. GCM10028914]|uniref:putative bifunctional diguanylate cyclase/phosphodiesterase n=1 Tax=Paenibacillus sp. GCM10028914 TaxID=3273416 RepID=UPI0036D2C6DA